MRCDSRVLMPRDSSLFCSIIPRSKRRPSVKRTAGIGFGINARCQFAKVSTIGREKFLKTPRRTIKPRLIKRPHDLCDEIVLGARFEARQRFDGREIAAPTFGNIIRDQSLSGRPTKCAFRRAGEATEGIQSKRERTFVDLSPHPIRDVPCALRRASQPCHMPWREEARRLTRVPCGVYLPVPR